MSKRVLILGAGYGGIQAALTLQKKKKKNDDLEIFIIDKNPYHTLLTELHEIAGNRIEEEGVLVYLKDIFEHTDVHVIQDCIEHIDFENQTLTSSHHSYAYDYLVLGVGSEPNFYGIPGMKEHALTLWSYQDALKIKEHIKNMFHKASLTSDLKKRQAYLTFTIGGGGFTGTEMIGELSLWADQLALDYNIPRHDVTLLLVEALPHILPILDESLIKKSMKYLTHTLGIVVKTNAPIRKVREDGFELDQHEFIKTYTLIWTGGVQANHCFDPIALEKGSGARICVNEYTQTNHKNVFAVGDFALFMMEENKPLPALVESAMQTGKSAAKNILHSLRKESLEKCKPKLHGVMVSMGKNYAVADLMGLKLSSILALFMKHLINLHYLFDIGGFGTTKKYVQHEFFPKHKKGMIHQHLSKMTPSFWLSILRVYLGYMWLVSGMDKIKEGWLSSVMLTGSTVDATTGASLMQLVSSHTPAWYAWMVDIFIIPNALLFQIFMVLAEIGLGLAFITGTFTFIAAVASIGLNINFLLSTGLYDLWYLVSSIAMLGGAGRSFGVDHYLLPYLGKQWSYFIHNKKLNIFLKTKNKKHTVPRHTFKA